MDHDPLFFIPRVAKLAQQFQVDSRPFDRIFEINLKFTICRLGTPAVLQTFISHMKYAHFIATILAERHRHRDGKSFPKEKGPHAFDYDFFAMYRAAFHIKYYYSSSALRHISKQACSLGQISLSFLS